MSPASPIDVVLPVLDEEDGLRWLLPRLPPGHRPIVVDNDSTDRSAEVARELGAEVVTEPLRGFGAACWRGLTAAEAPIVAFMDADGSLDPAELPAVTDPVASGAADLVLGARRPEKGAWPLHGRLANRVLAFELRRRVGVRVTDLGPMRAARREALIGLGIQDRRFGWPLEMVLRAADEGWRVEEVGVTYRPRQGGRSKVTGSLSGTARAVRDMSRVLR